MPRPSYPLFDHLTRLDLVAARSYDIEYHSEWTIDLESVERAWTHRTRAVLVVSPNNPTGSFVKRQELDRVVVCDGSLDVLAQQIVAESACEDYADDTLFDLVRRAYPYRNLPRRDFDSVVSMLASGFATRRGRRAALVHRDEVNHTLRGRRAARLIAMTSGGAIPETADYRVVLEPEETFIGTLNEDFAFESLAGDVFQLGNASYRIVKVETGKVLVEDARGQPPTMPFWLGESLGRTDELSHAVSRLSAQADAKLEDSVEACERWLRA